MILKFDKSQEIPWNCKIKNLINSNCYMVCSVCEDLAINLAMPIPYYSYSYRAMNTLLHCNYHHSYVCLSDNQPSLHLLIVWEMLF